ncbi:MAG: hypothetical protein Q4D79_15315 [Propionibacteriaceae bacterium]|nr:hypothetical protein [Propionibacteriaceae bacterium]
MIDPEVERELQDAGRQFPQLASMFEELRGVMAELERESQEAEARSVTEDQADEERVERARSGELGPEWQRIQRRIDEGETSLEDVFTGRDASSDAVELRQMATRNLGRLHEQWAKEAEDDPDAENPLMRLQSARLEQEARVEDVMSQIRDAANRW